jgi:S1-C subfamily serine protease
MEHFENTSRGRGTESDMHRAGFYETGSTTPPKDRGVLVTVVLILSILLVSINQISNILKLPASFDSRDTMPLEEDIQFATQAASEGGDICLEKVEAAQVPGLGFSGYEVPELLCYVDQVPNGFYITAVEEGSDAANQGLQPGDVLVSLNGSVVTDEASIRQILQTRQVGDRLEAGIYRRGYRKITLTLGE